jgi:DNA-3-methyladenine glycosylase
MHWCANVVCGPEGVASAVLLRAGEVVDGAELARARRPSARSDRDLARGPARLAQALGLDGSFNGAYVCDGGPVTLSAGAGVPRSLVRTGPRVGIAGPGGDGEVHPWRFWVDGEPTVSVFRPGVRRRRGDAAG